jgi:hypothetical protein
VLSAALIGSGALAQSTGPDKGPATQAGQPTQSQPAASGPGSENFVTEQNTDEWRAGKLIGVAVYGPDDKKIGTIKDIMIGHDGAVREAVIGVGGFLGIGEKNVAVPFHDLQWRTETRTVSSMPSPPPTGAASGIGGGGTGATSEAAKPQTQTIDPAAAEANQGHPDKALLNMTVAQLKAAPDFKWAPDPYDQVDAAARGESHAQPQSPKP